jgi:hypothetical protein
MARRSRLFVAHKAHQAGFRSGLYGPLRGGTYRAAPARISKYVGSPATDRAARYDDVARFKHDVRKSERIVLG